MPSLTSTLVRWLAPAPLEPPVWAPPALSAAATAPPPAMTPTIAQNTPVPQEWQQRGWDYYRHTGAARQGVDWLANGISRLHLYVGLVQPDGAGDPVPIRDGTLADAAADAKTAGDDGLELPDEAAVTLAEEILAELHDGPVGQRDMLYKLAVHILVPGESWLVGYPRPPAPGSAAAPVDGTGGNTAAQAEQGTAWAVVSRREWEPAESDSIRVKLPRHPARGADGWVVFPAGSTVVIPVYQPDPEDATLPTSRFESIVRDLDELDGLARRIAADIRSRLIGAGVFAVPESATLANPAQSDAGGVNPLHTDPLIAGLRAAMREAIKDQDSPAAHLPIILKISDEAIAKLQHLTFSTPFDEQIPILRDAARRAVAVGLDIPSSIVTGVEDLNHWSAWAVSEDAILSHLGPLAALICTTLTREVLWPVLRANGHVDVERLAIWWNAEAVTLRPDRSANAIEAKKLNKISDRAFRRELGFTEDDAPDPAEDQPAPGTQSAPGDRQPGEGGQPTPSDTPNPPQQPEDGNPDSSPATPSAPAA